MSKTLTIIAKENECSATSDKTAAIIGTRFRDEDLTGTARDRALWDWFVCGNAPFVV